LQGYPRKSFLLEKYDEWKYLTPYPNTSEGVPRGSHIDEASTLPSTLSAPHEESQKKQISFL